MSLDATGPAPGGSAAERGVLIIGYGNTLRRDDGVGVRAAELLASDARLAIDRDLGRIRVLTAYQLTPELALDIGSAAVVIFIDADLHALPGSVSIRRIDPEGPRSDAGARAEPGASSHHVGGGELVALAAELGGHRPEAIAIGIGVEDLELGEGLTPIVEAALPAAVDAVLHAVAEHRKP